jgi:type II secretory pathway pseudopilin PulG
VTDFLALLVIIGLPAAFVAGRFAQPVSEARDLAQARAALLMVVEAIDAFEASGAEVPDLETSNLVWAARLCRSVKGVPNTHDERLDNE